MAKIYKGVIQSLLPQKGFGFITPVWSSGNSRDNIFFSLKETKGGKCYIPALASAEHRKEVIGKRGTKTFVPNEPQVVFFELEVMPDNKPVAINIRDAQGVTPEEAAEADKNTEKPVLSQPTEETVDLMVKPVESERKMTLDELEAACDRSLKKSRPTSKPVESVPAAAAVETEEQETTPSCETSNYSEQEQLEIEEEEEEDFQEDEEEEIDPEEYGNYDEYYK